MTPSTTTGTRAAAPPTMKPARAAISSPPTSASTASGEAPCPERPPLRRRRHLAGQRRVVDAGAPAGHLGRRAAGERGDEGGRRGGVADAHVAGDQAAGAAGHRVGGHRGARRRGPAGLVDRHGRAPRQVGRARPDLAPEQARRRRGRRHADVDHDDLGPGMAGQHVDGRPAGAEVGHHLGGDLLGPGRHALVQHAVVAGEHGHDRRLGHRRRAGAGDGGELDAERLHPPRAPRGLVSRSCRAAASAPAPASSGVRLSTASWKPSTPGGQRRARAGGRTSTC